MILPASLRKRSDVFVRICERETVFAENNATGKIIIEINIQAGKAKSVDVREQSSEHYEIPAE